MTARRSRRRSSGPRWRRRPSSPATSTISSRSGLAQIPPDSPIASADRRRARLAARACRLARDARARSPSNTATTNIPAIATSCPITRSCSWRSLYAPDDFSLAQTIVCTSGWDTDCNAGNVGCLIGAMLGLDGLEARRDWRGPIADRMLDLLGRRRRRDQRRGAHRLSPRRSRPPPRRRSAPLPPPKNGARFHFSLPGSVQGFRAVRAARGALSIENEPFEQGRALLICAIAGSAPKRPVAAITPTFAPPEVVDMRTYDLMATPLVYPGQMLRARVVGGSAQRCAGRCRAARAASTAAATPCATSTAKRFGSRPATRRSCLASAGSSAASRSRRSDRLALARRRVRRAGRRSTGFVGTARPTYACGGPTEPSDFWRRAWVNGVSHFAKTLSASLPHFAGPRRGHDHPRRRATGPTIASPPR